MCERTAGKIVHLRAQTGPAGRSQKGRPTGIASGEHAREEWSRAVGRRAPQGADGGDEAAQRALGDSDGRYHARSARHCLERLRKLDTVDWQVDGMHMLTSPREPAEPVGEGVKGSVEGASSRACARGLTPGGRNGLRKALAVRGVARLVRRAGLIGFSAGILSSRKSGTLRSRAPHDTLR